MGGKKYGMDWMTRMRRLQDSGYFKPFRLYNFIKSYINNSHITYLISHMMNNLKID